MKIYIPSQFSLLLRAIMVLVFGGIMTSSSFAQINPYACQDSTIIQYGKDCSLNGTPNFDPHCYCNGKTYINDCVALYLHGVQNINSQDGPCEPFIDYFYPNPVFRNTANYNTLNYYVGVNNPNTVVHLDIINVFDFNIYYIHDYTFTQLSSAPYIAIDNIPVYNFPRGVYITRASTDGFVLYKKFVVM